MRGTWLCALAMLAQVAQAGEPSKAEPVKVEPKLVVHPEEAAAYHIANDKGTATLYVNATTGSPDVALSRLELEPGAAVPEHSHEAGEYLLVLSGAAEMTVNGAALAVKEGDAVFIPKGAKHTAKVPADAKGPLKAVQVYSPAGSEQRYTKGPKLR